jgi:hypothetical protein
MIKEGGGGGGGGEGAIFFFDVWRRFYEDDVYNELITNGFFTLSLFPSDQFMFLGGLGCENETAATMITATTTTTAIKEEEGYSNIIFCLCLVMSGFSIVGVGDAMAAVVGQVLSRRETRGGRRIRHIWLGTKKCVEGSVAGCLCAYGLVLMVACVFVLLNWVVVNLALGEELFNGLGSVMLLLLNVCKNWLCSISMWVIFVLVFVMEAYVNVNDNILLPLFGFCLFLMT